jgi:Ras-related GTP-binding protein A/B
VRTLIPNAAAIKRHLTIFAEACSATEVILFERTTFLVVATSDVANKRTTGSNGVTDLTSYATPSARASLASNTDTQSEASVFDPENPYGLDATRLERTSELVKAFKFVCTRQRLEFKALEMELPDFTAVLDELTKNTYVMVIVHDPTIGTYHCERTRNRR